MKYPSGEIDKSCGPIEWQIDSATNISVSTADVAINGISYRGNAQVQKRDGKWVAMFGDIYLCRITNASEPTMRAKEFFRDLVLQVAAEVETEDNMAALNVAELRDAVATASTAIIQLREEIDENEDIIAEAEAELRELGEVP